MSSSEDDTTRVEAMLDDCSLLDCDEDWNKVSFPETVSSPEDSTIIVGALPGSSLLGCSSSENCFKTLILFRVEKTNYISSNALKKQIIVSNC